MKGKTKTVLGVLGIILVLGVLASWGGYLTLNASGTSTNAQGQIVTGAQKLESTGNFCGDAKTATVTLTQHNGINETGDETYDSTCYAYILSDGKEQLATTVTDTTAGTFTANCGQSYRLRCIGVTGVNGDSAFMMGLVVGAGASIAPDGTYIDFTPNAPAYSLDWKSKQHATLEFRVRDMLAEALMYNDDDNNQQDYEATGANFTSSTNNVTALAVGASGELKVRVEARSTGTDTDHSDFGTYILVNASTATWQTPHVAKFTNGAGEVKTLSNIKGSLNSRETNVWSNVEYVYFTPDSITDDSVFFELGIRAVSGINPGDDGDVSISFVPKSAAAQLGGAAAGLFYSGATDAASPDEIMAPQDVFVATS